MATIAAELGVSTASVCNALNRPERVSAGLRQRVLAVATRIGYAGPQAATRLLASGRADAIAVLFTAEMPTALQDPAALAFLGGISNVCESAGLSLVLIPDRSTQPGARAAAVADAIVDGFVVYSLRDGDPLLEAVLQRDVATVVIDAPRAVSGADWVGADDRTAMCGLGDYLSRMGHRQVGIIAPQLNETRLNGPVEQSRWSGSGYALMRERIEGLLAGLHLDAGAVVVEERFQADLPAGAPDRKYADLRSSAFIANPIADPRIEWPGEALIASRTSVSRRRHAEHRSAGPVQQLVRSRSEHRARERALPVGADHDQPGVVLVRRVQQGLGRFLVDELDDRRDPRGIGRHDRLRSAARPRSASAAVCSASSSPIRPGGSAP